MEKKAEKHYERLLADLVKLYETTLLMGVEAQRRHKVHTFWQMSERIRSDEASGALESANIVRRVSEDFTARYGGGFKMRNVSYIRDFARMYTEEALKEGLTWNHYKKLMLVEDEAERAHLEALAATVTARQLERMIKAGLRELAPVDLDVALRPRDARTGLVKVRVEPFGRRLAFADLGFGALHPLERPLPEGVADGGYAAWSKGELQAAACEPGERYCYDAVLYEVLDGDTVRVRLNLCFGRHRVEKIRLRHVDARSVGESAGREAKGFLAERLPPGQGLRVLTYSHDMYGRWVGDLFYGVGRRRDRFANRELIDAGMAKFVDMRT